MTSRENQEFPQLPFSSWIPCKDFFQYEAWCSQLYNPVTYSLNTVSYIWYCRVVQSPIKLTQG